MWGGSKVPPRIPSRRATNREGRAESDTTSNGLKTENGSTEAPPETPEIVEDADVDPCGHETLVVQALGGSL